MTWLKRLFYPLYIYPRTTGNTKKRLHELFSFYKKRQEEGNSEVKGNLKLFSNMEEDGIILNLLASINVAKGYFVDVGSNDCINSNCANLAFNFDWSGVFIDADKKLLNIGKRNYKFFGKKQDLKFVDCFLFPENINDVVGNHVSTKEIDFMSIDIDGNDYAIWQALEVVKPKLVVIENKIELGKVEIVIPAQPTFSSDEWGASIVSMTKLSEEKSYTLVAINCEGFNGFYMRNDCFEMSGLRPLALETVLSNDSIMASFYSENKMSELIKRTKSTITQIKH